MFSNFLLPRANLRTRGLAPLFPGEPGKVLNFSVYVFV